MIISIKNNNQGVAVGKVNIGGTIAENALYVPIAGKSNAAQFGLFIDLWKEDQGAVIRMSHTDKSDRKIVTFNHGNGDKGPQVLCLKPGEPKAAAQKFQLSDKNNEWVLQGFKNDNSAGENLYVTLVDAKLESDEGEEVKALVANAGNDQAATFSTDYISQAEETEEEPTPSKSKNPFKGNWKDGDGHSIMIEDGEGVNTVAVQFLDDKNREETFSGFYELLDAPLIFVNFSDDADNANNPGKLVKKNRIDWTNGTKWDRVKAK